MGTIRGERTVEIEAAPHLVYAVAADIELAPEWQPALKDVEVHERDAQRRALTVETESDAKVRTIRSRLRLCPIARRSTSASPAENPASAIATCIPCSWKSGTPRVRSRIGSSDGCR